MRARRSARPTCAVCQDFPEFGGGIPDHSRAAQRCITRTKEPPRYAARDSSRRPSKQSSPAPARRRAHPLGCWPNRPRPTCRRYRGSMSGEEQRACPQCGAPVSYTGRGRRPVWCSSRCRNIAAVTRRGAREAAVQIRMIDVSKTPRPRPERPPTREERDESALSRVAPSSRLTRQLLARLERRRRAGELDSEVWDDVTAMLDHFIPIQSPRATPPAVRPRTAALSASATTLPEIIAALDRLSAGLETGRIYDRDVVTLGPAVDRLGNAWVRRPRARNASVGGLTGDRTYRMSADVRELHSAEVRRVLEVRYTAHCGRPTSPTVGQRHSAPKGYLPRLDRSLACRRARVEDAVQGDRCATRGGLFVDAEGWRGALERSPSSSSPSS